MSALLINETFLNTFLRTQKSGFALKSVFLSEFALLRAFLSAQKSTQGPTEPTSFDCDFDWILTKQEQVNCENLRCGLGRVIQIFTL